jgi:hypothetical protein
MQKFSASTLQKSKRTVDEVSDVALITLYMILMLY